MLLYLSSYTYFDNILVPIYHYYFIQSIVVNYAINILVVFGVIIDVIRFLSFILSPIHYELLLFIQVSYAVDEVVMITFASTTITSLCASSFNYLLSTMISSFMNLCECRFIHSMLSCFNLYVVSPELFFYLSSLLTTIALLDRSIVSILLIPLYLALSIYIYTSLLYFHNL